MIISKTSSNWRPIRVSYLSAMKLSQMMDTSLVSSEFINKSHSIDPSFLSNMGWCALERALFSIENSHLPMFWRRLDLMFGWVTTGVRGIQGDMSQSTLLTKNSGNLVGKKWASMIYLLWLIMSGRWLISRRSVMLDTLRVQPRCLQHWPTNLIFGGRDWILLLLQPRHLSPPTNQSFLNL